MNVRDHGVYLDTNRKDRCRFAGEALQEQDTFHVISLDQYVIA